MKTNNVLKIFALMLVLALMLSSCGNAGGKSYDPDEPVTAEPLMENFIEFTETTTPIYDIVSMLDEYGKLQSTNEDYTVFCNETKDHLNNLTKTFAVYENETGKTVLTLKNTYADEYRGTDKHGNPYRAPNELNVKVYTTNGVSVIVATYSTYTPIDDEIIKEEELKESYYKTVRTEFYDMQGNLLAKSNDTIDPKVEGSTSRFTALSLGRTVVLLDRYDNTVVRTFDGDTEVVSVPDAIVGEYYYYFGQSDSSGSYSNKANKLEVCDENGKVVCTYTFSLNPTTMPNASVLDNGDVMIQNLVVTDALTPDAYMDGTGVMIDTFILDVESGKLISVDFDYYISQAITRDDIIKMDADSLPSENVRNYASGYKINPGKELMVGEPAYIFFDNLLNVNFVPEEKFGIESNSFMPGKLLKDGYRLITPTSGATKKAIVDSKGNVVSYVPDDAVVTDSNIVTAKAVYDFSMNLKYELYDRWNSSYDVEAVGSVGDYAIFNATETYTDSEGEHTKNHVYFIYAGTNPSSDEPMYDEEGNYIDRKYYYDQTYYNYTFVKVNEGVALIRSEQSGTYALVGGDAQVLISIKTNSAPVFYVDTGKVQLVKYYVDGEYKLVRIYSSLAEQIGG